VRLFVWYPAADPDAPVLRHGDYFEVDAGPEPYSAALRQRDMATLQRQFSPSDSALTRRILETPVPARRSPDPMAGSHPVVVHVLGRNDYQQEATVLWEYLASHGYVVVVPPQMGACADSARLAFDGPSVEVQARDVAFALDVAAGWSWADTSRVAIVGHSSGAVVALGVADVDPRVQAIVSLDGSIATDEGGDLLRSMGTGRVETPLLDLLAAGHPGRDTAVLDSLARGPVHRWAFGTGEPPRAATHFDFQNWPLFATLTGVEDERGTPYRPSAYGRDLWLAAIRLTGAFLDRELSGNESGLADWRRDPPVWLSGVARPIPEG
jgi:dienelactone hydrolase